MKKILILGINADIGKNIASFFLKDGLEVVGTYRKKKPVFSSKNISLYKCDLTKRGDINKLIKNLKKIKFKWDYIFSSVGTSEPISKFFETKFNTWKNSINVNFISQLEVIHSLYSFIYNDDNKIEFPKHRFKKFIKDIVLGTIERNEIIIEELDRNLGVNFDLFKLDKIFQVILKSATYEILYKPNVSIKIIIKEYLDASNFFLNESQTKYLNALLDNAAKKLRPSNA